MRPYPLPTTIPPAFAVGEALSLGVSRRRLRAQDLQHPFYGARTTTTVGDIELVQLLMRLIPGHAFLCGLSAAAVYGAPLPLHDEARAFHPITVGVPSEHTRIRRDGVRGSRMLTNESDVVMREGIRLLTPERLWVDLSRTQTLPRLVAITDWMLRRAEPLTRIPDLAAAQQRFVGHPGSQKRNRALELADEGSESPKESLVRVLLVSAGLARPECNVNIYNGDQFVARVDMLYRKQKLIIEYDGDYHRDPDQWSRDQVRRAELEALGYRMTVVTARDFDNPRQLINRIRRLLAV